MGKVYTRSQIKTAQKNFTLWGGTYLHGLYKGVPPNKGGGNMEGGFEMMWRYDPETNLGSSQFKKETRPK